MKEVTFRLDAFEGPLDLLLHLISKNKVEISDIPISIILEQYLEYIKTMREFDLDVASEFVAMAAQLMYIKSKMLLPVYEDLDEEDARSALVEALLEYQRFKEASGLLSAMGEIGKDIFVKPQEQLDKSTKVYIYDYTAQTLVNAIQGILERSDRKLPPPTSSFHGIVNQESVPVSYKLDLIIKLLAKSDNVSFEKLVLDCQSRSEIVALFLAVLELSKTRKILIGDCNDGYALSLADYSNEEEKCSATA